LFDGSMGKWQNATNKYLGVRIRESGAWHYGWIRMDVNNNGNSVTIKDYACNMADNEPIPAGKISGAGVGNIAGNTTDVICAGKKLNFSHTSGQVYSVRLIDMNGRIMALYNYTGEAIDLSNYATGIYIVCLENAQLKKRFKITL